MHGTSYKDMCESRRQLFWSSRYIIETYSFHNTVTDDTNSGNSKYSLWSNSKQKLLMRNMRYGSQVSITSR